MISIISSTVAKSTEKKQIRQGRTWTVSKKRRIPATVPVVGRSGLRRGGQGLRRPLGRWGHRGRSIPSKSDTPRTPCPAFLTILSLAYRVSGGFFFPTAVFGWASMPVFAAGSGIMGPKVDVGGPKIGELAKKVKKIENFSKKFLQKEISVV